VKRFGWLKGPRRTGKRGSYRLGLLKHFASCAQSKRLGCFCRLLAKSRIAVQAQPFDNQIANLRRVIDPGELRHVPRRGSSVCVRTVSARGLHLDIRQPQPQLDGIRIDTHSLNVVTM
jgi:hypothetical protein